jgi:lipopolysaccharide biosynthesis glycosyltransferase
MATSIMSVLNNCTNQNEIFFHVLDNNITLKSKKILTELTAPLNAKIIFYDVSDITERLGNLKIGNISVSSYSRLYISEILPPNIERVIYLDCDTIVLNDLISFWELDRDGKVFCGVQDLVPNYFVDAIGISEQYTYINAGALLIDLNKYRKIKCQALINDLVENTEDVVPHHDQGIINKLFHTEMKIISPKYNFMTPFFLLNSKELSDVYELKNFYNDNEILNAKDNIVVAHLTQSFTTRPWIKNSHHPLQDEFLKYLCMTPYGKMKLSVDRRIFKVKLVGIMYKVLPNKFFAKLLRIIK